MPRRIEANHFAVSVKPRFDSKHSSATVSSCGVVTTPFAVVARTPSPLGEKTVGINDPGWRSPAVNVADRFERICEEGRAAVTSVADARPASLPKTR